jgi:hypothetical protein
LLSCLSPEWIRDGGLVAVRRAPTGVGEVNFDLRCREGGATLELANKFTGRPQRIVLHLPWFMTTSEVKVDGNKVAVKDGTVDLPVDSRRVEIRWARIRNAPAMSFMKAVNQYKAEYRKRYEALLHE